MIAFHRCYHCKKLIWPWQKKSFLHPTNEVVYWHHRRCFTKMFQDTMDLLQKPEEPGSDPVRIHCFDKESCEWMKRTIEKHGGYVIGIEPAAEIPYGRRREKLKREMEDLEKTGLWGMMWLEEEAVLKQFRDLNEKLKHEIVLAKYGVDILDDLP